MKIQFFIRKKFEMSSNSTKGSRNGPILYVFMGKSIKIFFTIQQLHPNCARKLRSNKIKACPNSRKTWFGLIVIKFQFLAPPIRQQNQAVHRMCPNHIKSSPLQFIVNVQESQNEIKSQSFDIHKYRRPLKTSLCT